MKTLINRLIAAVTLHPGSARFIAIIAVAAGTVSILIAATFGNSVPSSADGDEVDAAIANALAIVLSEANSPQDPEELEGAVWAVFAGLYPELGLQEMRKDPAFAEAEAEALKHFGHPEEIEAELQKDEAVTRARAEAFEAFTRGAEESKAAYFKALAAQLAELKLPSDSEIWNDPEWRRQREEPIRALAPRQPVGVDSEE